VSRDRAWALAKSQTRYIRCKLQSMISGSNMSKNDDYNMY